MVQWMYHCPMKRLDTLLFTSMLLSWMVLNAGCGQDTGDPPDMGTDIAQPADLPDGMTDPGSYPPEIYVPPPSCISAWECDDGNACTADDCTDGQCRWQPLSGTCDDGDPCTLGDACQDKQCLGQPLDCEDNNTCTDDSCKDGQCINLPSESAGCALTVAVTWPTRAAVLWAGTDTQLTGNVVSPAGPIQSVTLNGAPLTVGPGGNFSAPTDPVVGINILDVLVTDSHGRTAGALQSYLFGQWLHDDGSQAAVTLLNDASQTWLREDVFDDDDISDVDDLTTVAWDVLQNLDLDAIIPHPLLAEGAGAEGLWCEWTVDVTNVQWTVSEVDIDPVLGGMQVSASLTDLSAYVEAVEDWCPDALGWVFADTIGLETRISVDVGVDGHLDLSLVWVDVTVQGVSVDITGGAASLFDWLVNWFSGTFETEIENAVETWIPEKLVPVLDGVLAGFTSYSIDFDVPAIAGVTPAVPATLVVRAADAVFSSKGVAIALDLGMAALSQGVHPAPGSIARGDCSGTQPGPYFLPSEGMVEAALYEDFLNQVLYEAWKGGIMNVEVDGGLIGLDLSAYGLTEVTIRVDPYLPPVATSCRSPGQMEVQVGDLNLNATFSLAGGTGAVELFGSARVAVDLTVDGAPDPNEVAVTVQDIAQMGVDVVYSSGAVDGFDTLIEDLFATVVRNLLVEKVVAQTLASYPIPVVDVGLLVPGLPAGTEVTFEPASVGTDTGWMLVTGAVKAP